MAISSSIKGSSGIIQYKHLRGGGQLIMLQVLRSCLYHFKPAFSSFSSCLMYSRLTSNMPTVQLKITLNFWFSSLPSDCWDYRYLPPWQLLCDRVTTEPRDLCIFRQALYQLSYSSSLCTVLVAVFFFVNLYVCVLLGNTQLYHTVKLYPTLRIIFCVGFFLRLGVVL